MQTRPHVSLLVMIGALCGCGSDPKSPVNEVDAGLEDASIEDAGSSHAGPFFPDTPTLYSGAMDITCDSSDEEQRTVFLLLRQTGDEVRGRAWGLPSSFGLLGTQVSDVAGRARGSKLEFEPFELVWRDGSGVSGGGVSSGGGTLHLDDVVVRDDSLEATLTMHGTDGGDEPCVEVRTLTMRRDETAPVATLPDGYRDEVRTTIDGFAPLLVRFDELVDADVAITVRHDDAILTVETRAENVAEDLISHVTLTPTGAWPEGPITVELTNLHDPGGADTTAMLQIVGKPWVSATVDPGFELPLAEHSAWLRVTERLAQFRYPSAGPTSFSVLPSEGQKFGQTRGLLPALEAYVEPPANATRVIIDAADFHEELGMPMGRIEIRAVYPDRVVPFTQQSVPTDPEPVESALRPFAATIDSADGPFWIVADNNALPYSEINANNAFFDNLRFE